jgi:hypothetical protein
MLVHWDFRKPGVRALGRHLRVRGPDLGDAADSVRANRWAMWLGLAGCISAPLASACSCADVTPLQALGHSDLVFVGKVLSREETPPTFTVVNGDTTWFIYGGDMVRYRFAVDRGWKGEPVDTVAIYSVLSGAACGYMFEVGTTYLVYSYFLKPEWLEGTRFPPGTAFPALGTGLCIGNVPLDGAAQEPAVLGPPAWRIGSAPMLRLHQNRPNPFNPVTEIAYEIPRHSWATIRIFDARGRLTRTLLDREMPGGSFSRTWDGRDDSGRNVTSGVYFCELKAGSLRNQLRMTLIR